MTTDKTQQTNQISFPTIIVSAVLGFVLLALIVVAI